MTMTAHQLKRWNKNMDSSLVLILWKYSVVIETCVYAYMVVLFYSIYLFDLYYAQRVKTFLNSFVDVN